MQAIKIISIHAPREGSDRCTICTPLPSRVISIHAPREGSDARISPFIHRPFGFLSTLPARGATANVLKNKRLSSAAFV